MQVIITTKADKQFKRLTEIEKAKVKKRLIILEKTPYEGKKLAGKLAGQRTLRAWPYRIIYYIDENTAAVYITNIRHRQGVYK